MRRNTFRILALLLAFISFAAFSADQNGSQIILENQSSINIMTQENGSRIFYRQDRSVPLVDIIVSYRAGFSYQTPMTQGLFSLYAKLIQNQNGPFKGDLSTEVKDYSVNYRITLSSEELESFFRYFCTNLAMAEFQDSEIRNAVDELVQEFEITASAIFLNKTVDSKIFGTKSFSSQSTTDASWLKEKKPQEIRSMLDQLKNDFFNISNCSFFISGNFEKQTMNELADTFLSKIAAGNPVTVSSQGFGGAENSQKKFVLVSKNFSKDMMQTIVQWTDLSIPQGEILSAVFNNYGYLGKTLVQEKSLNIQNREYLDASTLYRKNTSRHVIQALLQNGPDLDDFAKYTLFMEKIRDASDVEQENFVSARNTVLNTYRKIIGSSKDCMELFSDLVATENQLSNSFYTDFLSRTYEIQKLNQKEIHSIVCDRTPYVFVLLNSDNFKKTESQWKEDGFEIITQDLHNSGYDKSPDPENALEAIDSQNFVHTFSSAQLFEKENQDKFFETKLSNQIPLYFKKDAFSENAMISIMIDGGEMASPKKQRLLRTVLTNAFARNLQGEVNLLKKDFMWNGETKVYATTRENVSIITLEFTRNDLFTAFQAISNAIIFGELNPATADILANQQRLAAASPMTTSTQLRKQALQTIYRGTDLEKCFSTDSNILQETNYKSISIDYVKLLDSKLWKILVIGNFDITKVQLAAEESLGSLSPLSFQEQRKPVLRPALKNKKQYYQISHTFTSDKTKEQAPKGVPVLVPTKTFQDPVQFYFQVPENQTEEQLFYALLFYMESLMNQEMKGLCQVSSSEPDPVIKVACLGTSGIRNTQDFLDCYRQCRSKLLTELENEFAAQEEDGDVTQQIRKLWTRKILRNSSSIQGMANLIQDSILKGNPKAFIQDYVEISRAQVHKFLLIANAYLPEDPVFKAYSKDSN